MGEPLSYPSALFGTSEFALSWVLSGKAIIHSYFDRRCWEERLSAHAQVPGIIELKPNLVYAQLVEGGNEAVDPFLVGVLEGHEEARVAKGDPVDAHEHLVAETNHEVVRGQTFKKGLIAQTSVFPDVG